MSDGFDPESDYLKAVSILEQNMRTELWFYEQVLSRVDETMGAGGDSIKQKLNYDFLVHLARFFFLFNSLDMNDRNMLSAFIDAHNAKVVSDIDRKLIEGSVKEKRKTIFSDVRKSKIMESCFALGRPAFAITELAHFLTDFMSEASATRMVDDLVLARVLSRVDDPRIEAADNRKLIVSDGFLENLYAKSLIQSRAPLLSRSASTQPNAQTGVLDT
ncbi:MAG: hypothetical protein AB8B94_17245 [Hyphomicrobiales bacterium]